MNDTQSGKTRQAAAKRFAVIGNPVMHSRSPDIHQLFGRQTGISLQYERIQAPTDAFASTLSDFFSQGGRGLNVTVPFKQQAWQLASTHLSARARMAQAVNTLWMQEGALHGCNTDGVGLVRDLQRLGVPCKDARILLIGAGGAARGVMGPLLETGCAELRIVNRTPERASELIAGWQSIAQARGVTLHAGGLPQASSSPGWDLVINASASSLGEAAPDIPSGIYAPGAWGYDMMYSARPTPYMQQAVNEGASHTADGLGMLVAQAAESFLIWHGVTPAIEPVIGAIRTELEASLSNTTNADKKQT
jgi:shikimate dehydrogenase